MNELIAKPLAIATCGVFNMKRRAKEALRAQGSIEWVVIVVCIAVALIAARTRSRTLPSTAPMPATRHVG